MKIRLAKIKDCLEISKLKKDVWETTYRGIYPDSKLDNFNIEENCEKFKSIILNPNIDLYVVCDGKKIIGYMDCGEIFRPYKDYKNEIGLMYVLKDYQGKGVGKQLFLKGYENLKNKGVLEFIISCNKYNLSAQEFYKKMGGQIIGIDEDLEDRSIPQIKFLYKIK